MENFRHSPESQNEQQSKRSKIETCQLTTFGEIHDYVPEDMFSKSIFETKIPLNKDGACKFLNLERAEEYFCRLARSKSIEYEEFWFE